MSAACDDCGRTVPPEEAKDGPYVDGAGKWTCGTCISDTIYQVERWWPELKGTVSVDGEGQALSLAEILHRLGLQP